MSDSERDDGLDGGSPLSDIDASSPPPTPGLAQTPGREDADEQHPPQPQHSLDAGRGALRRAPRRASEGNGSSSTAPASRKNATKKPAKQKKQGWKYVTEEELAEAAEAKVAAEQETQQAHLNRLGRPMRRRSLAAVEKADNNGARSSAAPIETHPDRQDAEFKPTKKNAPAKIKLNFKKGRKTIENRHNELDGIKNEDRRPGKADGSERASVDKEVESPVNTAPALGEDEDDAGPAMSNRKRAKQKKRSARTIPDRKSAARATRRQLIDDDDDVDMGEASSFEDDDASLSDAVTESDEAPAKKKSKTQEPKEQKAVSSTRKEISDSFSKQKGPASPAGKAASTLPSSSSSSSLRTQRPNPSTATTSSPSSTIVRPEVRPVVRKTQAPSLLSKLMGSGNTSGSNTPLRHAVPRPRPPGQDAPKSLSRPSDTKSTSSPLLGKTPLLVTANGARKDGARSGLNGEHVTAAEMHALRQCERSEHDHPQGLFDLLEDAEIMMQFEEETRQELRYDAFLHKHKLYKPGRTEGVWQLVEHVKKRRGDPPAPPE